MEFWAAAEVEKQAYKNVTLVRRLVEEYLNSEFEKSSLALFKCRIRYIPIVMPESAKARYPARSKLRKKENLYDCAPQLDYDVFVDGTLEEQLREYIRGIEETADHLHKLGATPQQVEEFNAVLAGAADAILREHAGS